MDKSVRELWNWWCVLFVAYIMVPLTCIDVSSIAENFQEVIHRERQGEVEGAPEASKRTGATRWLSNAIEMENTMYATPFQTNPKQQN
jgi:hypothetical protein